LTQQKFTETKLTYPWRVIELNKTFKVEKVLQCWIVDPL